jgi:hypothetical protein
MIPGKMSDKNAITQRLSNFEKIIKTKVERVLRESTILDFSGNPQPPNRTLNQSFCACDLLSEKELGKCQTVSPWS